MTTSDGDPPLALDLATFDVAAMTQLGALVRKVAVATKAASMEAIARLLVNAVHDALVDGEHHPACPRVELHTTVPFAELPDTVAVAGPRCWARLATAGTPSTRPDLLAFDDPRLLTDRPDLVGLTQDPGFLGSGERAFQVFHLEDAGHGGVDRSFVSEHDVRSVLGVAATLPNGEVFSVTMFSRVAISARTALLFEPFAIATKIALSARLRPRFDREVSS